MEYDIANPDPGGTIASLSSLGYSIEAAIADLIDNSVSAGAARIHVSFTWQGATSWIAVVDDGRGMDAAALLTAMTLAARGPSTDRAPGDLGRFGMGLKTASFSQARQLTVHTRAAGSRAYTRTWDLDEVISSGEWRLLKGADDPTAAILDRLLPEGAVGTAVVWRRLHRYAGATDDDTRAQQHFYTEMERVERHLGMVFGRLLTGRNHITITVNGQAVAPWDPFMAGHPSVLALPPEEIPACGGVVRVEPFILPNQRRLTEDEREAAAGPKGWLDQQGFYIYRRRRLILAGDWLGIRAFRRDDRYNLARIAVDVPVEADSAWRVDVRKSSVVPPVGIRRHLERIGRAARERAAAVMTHRGRMAARTHSADFVYAWNLDHTGDRIRCRINREHPLVRRAVSGASADREELKALLRLLEETVPVAALRTMHRADTADDPEPFAEAAPEEVDLVARRVYEALLAEGRTPAEARRRISQMQPFNEFTGFWNSTT